MAEHFTLDGHDSSTLKRAGDTFSAFPFIITFSAGGQYQADAGKKKAKLDFNAMTTQEIVEQGMVSKNEIKKTCLAGEAYCSRSKDENDGTKIKASSRSKESRSC